MSSAQEGDIDDGFESWRAWQKGKGSWTRENGCWTRPMGRVCTISEAKRDAVSDEWKTSGCYSGFKPRK